MPIIIVLLALPLLGALACLTWRRFLRVFILLSSVLFLFAPALLSFSKSEPLYFALFTLNLIGARMINVVFPFIIVDLYWQNNPRGWLGWLMPGIVVLIYANVIVSSGPFTTVPLDNAYAMVLLTLSAIGFYLLCYPILPSRKMIAQQPGENGQNIRDSFREHNLSERETEVALLIVGEGLNNKEIGERLFISPLTVRGHVQSIYRKYGVKNRVAFFTKVLINA